MIENLKSLGKTVFLTTHYMDEAQRLADRVAIIADGKIVAEGTPASLAERDGASTTISFALPADVELPQPWRERATTVSGATSLRTSEPVQDLHDLTRWALDNRVDLAGLQVTGASLEDVYLQLTASEETPTG
jgi:ABC-2 type transport system ATP-binding protein